MSQALPSGPACAFCTLLSDASKPGADLQLIVLATFTLGVRVVARPGLVALPACRGHAPIAGAILRDEGVHTVVAPIAGQA